MRRSIQTNTTTRLVAHVVLALLASGASLACSSTPLALTQHIEARQLATDLRVQFIRATDASNRAVMTANDADAAAAVDEAKQALDDVRRSIDTLRPMLEGLGDTEEIRQLATFERAFADYAALEREIFELAVENSNVKAQQLSFNPGSTAAGHFRAAVEAAVATAAPASRLRADVEATRAIASLLEIQVIQARHIAEADDEAMTRMESEMDESAVTAQAMLTSLPLLLPSKAVTHLQQADDALLEFLRIDDEIVTLSRRNSDVRSFALALGRKRTLTAQCDDGLRTLQEALAKHAFTGTR